MMTLTGMLSTRCRMLHIGGRSGDVMLRQASRDCSPSARILLGSSLWATREILTNTLLLWIPEIKEHHIRAQIRHGVNGNGLFIVSEPFWPTLEARHGTVPLIEVEFIAFPLFFSH